MTGATDQVISPPTDFLFRENNLGISAKPSEMNPQEVAPIVEFARHFNEARGMDIPPHQPYEQQISLQTQPVDPNDRIHLDDNQRMIIADSANAVSQTLNDNSMAGVKVEPTGQQSDLCFGIGSVLGVTKEALGCGFNKDAGLDMASLVPQEQRFNPVMYPRPSAGMSR